MQKIVIIDMDGTLLDSQKDITISVNYVRKVNHNLPPLEESFIVEAINMEVRNLPFLFYNTETYEERDRVVFEKHYAIQCTQNPYLYDGVLEMLHSLKDAGVKLSVATNAPTQFAVRMLESLSIASLFDKIIGADKVSHSKPSPEMLLKILDFYHFDAKKDFALMVGDNSKDMMSAKNANIEAKFATWGFSPDAEGFSSLKTPKELLSIVL